MTKIKIAVVGPGLMGKRHVELIQSNSDCQLAALVAPNCVRHHSFAQSLSVPLYHQVDSLISTQKIDAVIISSPNMFHAEQAEKFIEAGIPILLEKPICHSFDVAQKLTHQIELHSAKVLIGHHRVHSPILLKAKKLIHDGRLGNIVGIMGSALFYKPDTYFEDGPWRSQPGGGPILINLIHEISSFRLLCGEIVAVQAFSSSARRGYSVEDTVVVNFQFASGALGTFMLSDVAASSKSWEQTSQENKSYPFFPDIDCYSVVGTMGSLSIPTMRLNFYSDKSSRSWWKPLKQEVIPLERLDPLECQLAHFVKLVRGLASPLVSASDGLQNLKITEAIALAAKSRHVVYVN